MPEGSQESVSLRGLTPVGAGRFRRTFIHPSDETKCIKIDRTDSRSKSLSRLEVLRKKFRRNDLSGNEREILGYSRLISSGVDYTQYFPAFHGVVDTDLGPGLCVALLRGTDGQLPLTLRQCIRTGLLQDQKFSLYLREEYQKFSEFCERHLIVSASAGFENVAVIQVEGLPKLVSFDLKTITSKQLIPLMDWSATLKKMRIRRRFRGHMTVLDAASSA